MAEFGLKAAARTIQGKKVSRLRNESKVPGSIYGPNIEAQKVTFDYRELETTLRNAGGTNVIDVAVDGGDNIPVLAREVQRSVIKGEILHVDFLAPDMNKKIRAEVRLQIIGQSPLVISRQGIMITGPNTIQLEMLPNNLLNTVSVDISGLEEIGDTIAVKDLPLADGITVINDPEEMIVKIVQPSAARAAENEATTAALEGEEAQVIGEEGEEGEEEE